MTPTYEPCPSYTGEPCDQEPVNESGCVCSCREDGARGERERILKIIESTNVPPTVFEDGRDRVLPFDVIEYRERMVAEILRAERGTQ